LLIELILGEPEVLQTESTAASENTSAADQPDEAVDNTGTNTASLLNLLSLLNLVGKRKFNV